MRILGLLAAVILVACGSGRTDGSCGSAIDACERQCAPGIRGGICYIDPICDERTGTWDCPCAPCNPDHAQQPRDLSTFDQPPLDQCSADRCD